MNRMPDPDDKRLVCLQVSLSQEEVESVEPEDPPIFSEKLSREWYFRLPNLNMIPAIV